MEARAATNFDKTSQNLYRSWSTKARGWKALEERAIFQWFDEVSE